MSGRGRSGLEQCTHVFQWIFGRVRGVAIDYLFFNRAIKKGEFYAARKQR